MPKGIQLWSLPPMMERPRGPPDLKMIIVDIGDDNDANYDDDWKYIKKNDNNGDDNGEWHPLMTDTKKSYYGGTDIGFTSFLSSAAASR